MTIRKAVPVVLLIVAIACTNYATWMWSAEPTTHYHAHAIGALLIGCVLAIVGYRVAYPTRIGEQPRGNPRANGISLIQLLVVIVIAAILIGIGYPALTSAYRAATTPAVDEKLREVAVEKMYEDRGLEWNEIYAALAKAEWARRGWAWYPPTPPVPYTLDNVNARIAELFPDPNNPPNPAWAIPGRTSRQAVIDLGLTEPDPKKELGMQ